jgi:hypothetical protein
MEQYVKTFVERDVLRILKTSPAPQRQIQEGQFLTAYEIKTATAVDTGELKELQRALMV